MSNTGFEPWIGSKYFSENHFKLRVLVLGESHYGEASEFRPTFTTEIVRELAQDKLHPFFTKISKVLLGLDTNDSLDHRTRGEIWEHIAFYNYIPMFVGTEARIRPSSELWTSAKQPFLDIIQKLSPNVILVLGKELSKNIPELPDHIEICTTYHPSYSGFSYKQWNQLFAEAVKQAKSKNSNNS